MELVRLDSLTPRGWREPAVTVGNFDGVHRGHQALVAVAVRDGRAGSSVALTFDPHPSRVLSPQRAPAALLTVEQKAELLGGLGIERVAVLPFTRELAARSPEAFAAEVLAGALGARVVVVGSNFRFGHDRAGDVARLAELGERLGFRLHALTPVFHEGAPISSTRIREALSRGAVEAAAAMLGRRYFVDGTVVKGEGRGRTLGVPTANLDPVNPTLPAGGVYAAWCETLAPEPGPQLRAVVNVGSRPTFGGRDVTVEAHLLDFAGDLYGRQLRLGFAARIREERAFPGAEALRKQIDRDVGEARGVLVEP